MHAVEYSDDYEYFYDVIEDDAFVYKKKPSPVRAKPPKISSTYKPQVLAQQDGLRTHKRRLTNRDSIRRRRIPSTTTTTTQRPRSRLRPSSQG